jgi:hypothetical protein
LIGYGDGHGKIYWIWNEDDGKIVRASAVKFNEEPSFDGKPDPTEPKLNEHTATKFPETSDDSNGTEDFLNAEEVADLAREATAPPNNPIAEYTTNSPAMRQSTNL